MGGRRCRTPALGLTSRSPSRGVWSDQIDPFPFLLDPHLCRSPDRLLAWFRAVRGSLCPVKRGNAHQTSRSAHGGPPRHLNPAPPASTAAVAPSEASPVPSTPLPPPQPKSPQPPTHLVAPGPPRRPLSPIRPGCAHSASCSTGASVVWPDARSAHCAATSGSTSPGWRDSRRRAPLFPLGPI